MMPETAPLKDLSAQGRRTNISSTELSFAGFNPTGPFQPGDFILIHRNIFFSKMVRAGQRIRYSKKYAYWNHTALITSTNGDMVEALGKGLIPGHISKYQDMEYHLVRMHVSDEDAKEILNFSDYMIKNHAKYSISSIVSIFFTLLFGWKFVFGRVGTFICSGFVATALTRAGEIYDKPPEYMTPADLAVKYNVDPARGIEVLSRIK